MPETLTPPAEGNQPAPTVRDAIVDKYERTYGQQAPQAEPTVITTSTAISEPVKEPTLAEQMATLKAELLAEFKAQQPKPAEATPAVAEAEANWLKLLSEGKQAEAEKALSKIVAANSGFSDIQRNAVAEALQLFDARQQVAAYEQQVRQDPANVEALRMEKYITVAVQQRINDAQASGLIKTPADYVTVYKASVDAEVRSARELALTLRGEGRQEGQVRTTQVLSAVNLQPQKIDATRTQATPEPEAPESYQDYMAKRGGEGRVRHRLSPN